jgi:N-acetyl-anhydromuramyl-L-alanine amidase AmpD/photosystem II stability/assembly factor-like uncharacterized protein
MGRVALPFVAAGIAVVVCASGSAAQPGPLTRIFDRAAATYRVPEPLLLAEGYVNTRLEMPGQPALDGGVGIMHLSPAQVRTAARLIGASRKAVRHEARANVRAGAALLARARPRGGGPAAWYGALARIDGRLFADQVYATLHQGFSIAVRGELLRLRPSAMSLRGRSAAVRSRRSDYPNSFWHAASTANYTRSNRPLSHRIDTIVIHATEGSYAGTVAWFANPRARASAHYVVRSSDGEVTQVVHEKDIAWHAGNWQYNLRSIGIEHEAFENNCRWYTDALYRGSAQLVAYLAAKYLIPIDRKHIIGHSEVPDPNNPHLHGGADHHTDPGKCWKWKKYMALVRSYAQTKFATARQRIGDDARSRIFKAPRGWKRKGSHRSYAGSYAVTHSSSTRKPARYKLHVPRAGSYALYSWWPAGHSRSRSVPVGIDTTSGRKWVHVNERKGTGWRLLGTFDLRGKTRVVVSPRTAAAGTIAADAFKVELLSRRFESKLVTSRQGWLLSRAGLSRTSDAGTTWRTILPSGVAPQAIRGADWGGKTAYAAVATGSRTNPLELEWTPDGGATWRSVSLPLPPSADVAGPVDVQAVDALHLFVGVRLQPNGHALSRGLLLRSVDGGATWTSRHLPEGGDISFTSPADGWLVGGFDRESLYATHNSGRTWAPVKPRVRARGAFGTAYDPPAFSDELNGVVPVSLPAGNHSALAFATTLDGGHTWSQAAVVHVHRPLDLGETVASAVADPDTWFAASRGNLVELTGAGTNRTTVGPLPAGTTALQFSSPQLGWARTGSCLPSSCSVALYGTQNGGVTWSRISLPPASR